MLNALKQHLNRKLWLAQVERNSPIYSARRFFSRPDLIRLLRLDLPYRRIRQRTIGTRHQCFETYYYFLRLGVIRDIYSTPSLHHLNGLAVQELKHCRDAAFILRAKQNSS